MTAGLAVITGTEDRQHAYVALSRGTDTNMAYVFTVSPKLADPMPGPRPAPELARYDRITAERSGSAAPPQRPRPGTHSPCWPRCWIETASSCPPSQTRQQALADADHLAILHAIWTAQTTPAREQHYRDLLAAHLPPEHRREPGHQARWLWRTLRAAELAGLDPATSWPRRSASGTWPAPATWPPSSTPGSGTGSASSSRSRRARGRPRSPPSPTPSAAPTSLEIAALMDARKDRIGEHAAEHALPWAVTALGPVPDDPLDRLEWQKRAASIGVWRELSGYRDPADPIGPEPVAAAPDLRAAWHEALAALGPADGPDVRGMPDGRLLHLRDTYPIETAWAPQ